MLKYCHKSFRQCCRQQERAVDLPKQCFGPSVMCRHCGSLWKKVKHRNRLIPSKNTKTTQKAISFMQNDKSSKYRSSLARKCQQGKLNKMTIKCSVCLKNSVIPCNKPIKKPRKSKSLNHLTPDMENQRSDKKKKRRSRDKTAGLNISLSGSFLASTPDKVSTPIHKEKKGNEKVITPLGKVMTPLGKVKKMNKERLSNILKDESAKKRNSLTNFLKELY